jgi:hypothetical protein
MTPPKLDDKFGGILSYKSSEDYKLLEYGNLSGWLSIEEYADDGECKPIIAGYLYRSGGLMINGNELHMNSDYGDRALGLPPKGFPIRTVTWAGNKVVVPKEAKGSYVDSNKYGTLSVKIKTNFDDTTTYVYVTVVVSNGGIQGFCKTSDGNTTPYVCCANGKGTSKWVENTNWTRDLDTACKADANLINVSKSASNCEHGTHPIYTNTPNTANTTICKNGDFTVYKDGFGPSR